VNDTAAASILWNERATYPLPPFDPPARYPDLPHPLNQREPDPSNAVYPLVRTAVIRALGFEPHGGTQGADVLRSLGQPSRILIKPNWVMQERTFTGAVTTHGSVLRPIIDMLLAAFPGAEIIVGDIALQSTDLDLVWEQTGVTALNTLYTEARLPVRFLDLRRERARIHPTGFIERREPLAGDPLGYVDVALGGSSHLEPISREGTRFSVTDYEPGLAACKHAPGRHGYLIAGSALAADLFVNVPKLKTHCKAGMTACLKNLIGINGDKGWIPHYRIGPPTRGGDEFPDELGRLMGFQTGVRRLLQGRSLFGYALAQRCWSVFRKHLEKRRGAALTQGGAWPGNDTLWRSILDLSAVISRANAAGVIGAAPARAHLCVVDAIVCGEGEGPLNPTPKRIGAILCSRDPLVADLAAARVAGLDWQSIPYLRHAVQEREGSLPDPGALPVAVTGREMPVPLEQCPSWRFVPPATWQSQLRFSPEPAPRT
jgi:uncharacterized protein (DUF362 family)